MREKEGDEREGGKRAEEALVSQQRQARRAGVCFLRSTAATAMMKMINYSKPLVAQQQASNGLE